MVLQPKLVALSSLYPSVKLSGQGGVCVPVSNDTKWIENEAKHETRKLSRCHDTPFQRGRRGNKSLGKWSELSRNEIVSQRKNKSSPISHTGAETGSLFHLIHESSFSFWALTLQFCFISETPISSICILRQRCVVLYKRDMGTTKS